jgi:hypothetical protein
MELLLQRFSSGNDDTNGLFYNLDDCTTMAFTIEDEHREKKVKHETRIPAGVYKIALRNEGGYSAKYQKRFSDPSSKHFMGEDWHKGMLCVFNAPNWKIEDPNDDDVWQYILIHCGNDDDDTSGCILVGESAVLNKYRENGSIGNSVATYKKLYPVIRDALLSGEDVTLTVRDEIPA